MRIHRKYLPGITATLCAFGLISNAATLPGTALTPSVWLDASQLSLSDGAAVATWTDASGNGRNATQGTASRRPFYQTGIAGANNNPVVRFNTELQSGGSANQFLSFSGALANTASGILSLYVVSYDTGGRSVVNGRSTLVNTRSSTAAGNGFIFGYGSNPLLASYAHTGNTSASSNGTQTTPISSTGFNLLALSRSGLTSTLFDYTDTDSQTSTTTWSGFVNSTLTTTQVGTEGGGNYLFGDIAEIIAFDGFSLTTEENDQVLKYLGNKYDIAFATAVPEPSSIALFAIGATIAGAFRLRRKK